MTRSAVLIVVAVLGCSAEAVPDAASQTDLASYDNTSRFFFLDDNGNAHQLDLSLLIQGYWVPMDAPESTSTAWTPLFQPLPWNNAMALMYEWRSRVSGPTMISQVKNVSQILRTAIESSSAGATLLGGLVGGMALYIILDMAWQDPVQLSLESATSAVLNRANIIRQKANSLGFQATWIRNPPDEKHIQRLTEQAAILEYQGQLLWNTLNAVRAAPKTTLPKDLVERILRCMRHLRQANYNEILEWLWEAYRGCKIDPSLQSPACAELDEILSVYCSDV